MRLSHDELEELFQDMKLVNGIKECREILKNYLTQKGYKVVMNYLPKGGKDLVDAAAVKDGHSMAIMIGRRYPRKRRISALKGITGADNRVFFTREGAHQYRLMDNIEIIDAKMAEPLHRQQKAETEEDYDKDYDLAMAFQELEVVEQPKQKPKKERQKAGPDADPRTNPQYDPNWLEILETRA